MAHATADIPSSRPRRAQLKNSRYADFEMDKPEKKPKTPKQEVKTSEPPAPATDSSKKKRGRPPKPQTPSTTTVKENSPEPIRTLTKRGLKNSNLSKKGSASARKTKKKTAADVKPSPKELKDAAIKSPTAVKEKKKGRPPGKKNVLKVKTARRPLAVVKREVPSESEEDESEDDENVYWDDMTETSTFTERMKKKVQQVEEGKLKLQKLKNLAAQRFGMLQEKTGEEDDDDSDSDNDLLSSSDAASDVVWMDDDLMDGMESEESWGASEKDALSDDSTTQEPKSKQMKPTLPETKPLVKAAKLKLSQKKGHQRQSQTFLAGKKKVQEMKKKASALYDTPIQDAKAEENPVAKDPPETAGNEASGDNTLSKEQQKNFSAVWESEEYHKGKETLEKIQELASSRYGVEATKKQRAVKRTHRRFKAERIKGEIRTVSKTGETHITSDEYGEIVKRSTPENPVTMYKLGDKHMYTVTYSEDNPDVLTFALEPPPDLTPPKSNLSTLTEDLMKLAKTQQLNEIPVHHTTSNSEPGDSWSSERLLESSESQGNRTISILPSNFSGHGLQPSSDSSEQAQTIVVSAQGQEHILSEGDMQNAYTVEIQQPDGTTQEHVSFDNGLTFVVNDMPEGSGTVTQTTGLPVSLSDLADLATLQVASSDGQITQTLALPGFTFAQQGEDGEQHVVSADQIDPAVLKSLVAHTSGDTSGEGQPMVFIVKQEGEDVDEAAAAQGFTQWSICGDNGDQKVITKGQAAPVASANILNAAAELSRISVGRRASVVGQEFLEGEVNLERMKQQIAATSFATEPVGNENDS